MVVLEKLSLTIYCKNCVYFINKNNFCYEGKFKMNKEKEPINKCYCIK
jgi:hypothetical protein